MLAEADLPDCWLRSHAAEQYPIPVLGVRRQGQLDS